MARYRSDAGNTTGISKDAAAASRRRAVGIIGGAAVLSLTVGLAVAPVAAFAAPEAPAAARPAADDAADQAQERTVAVTYALADSGQFAAEATRTARPGETISFNAATTAPDLTVLTALGIDGVSESFGELPLYAFEGDQELSYTVTDAAKQEVTVPVRQVGRIFQMENALHLSLAGRVLGRNAAGEAFELPQLNRELAAGASPFTDYEFSAYAYYDLNSKEFSEVSTDLPQTFNAFSQAWQKQQGEAAPISFTSRVEGTRVDLSATLSDAWVQSQGYLEEVRRLTGENELSLCAPTSTLSVDFKALFQQALEDDTESGAYQRALEQSGSYVGLESARNLEEGTLSTGGYTGVIAVDGHDAGTWGASGMAEAAGTTGLLSDALDLFGTDAAAGEQTDAEDHLFRADAEAREQDGAEDHLFLDPANPYRGYRSENDRDSLQALSIAPLLTWEYAPTPEDPEVPETPDPETPDPEEPETPDPGTPDPETPSTPDPEKPVTPVTPEVPATPVTPANPTPQKPAAPRKAAVRRAAKRRLPQTGDSAVALLAAAVAGGGALILAAARALGLRRDN